MQRSVAFLAVCAAQVLAAESDTHTLPWLYYDYDNRGPSTWASVDSDYATCGTGVKQSPVNIGLVEENPDLKPLQFFYSDSPVSNSKLVNIQKAIQVNFETSPGYFIDPTENQRYDVAQLHFHSPSEHGIGGGRYPLEMHIVHTAANSSNPHQYAVVGMFFNYGDHNELLNAVWHNLPSIPMPAFDHYANSSATFEYTEVATASTLEMIVAGEGYYTYSGSLTTPPCTEGIKWFVMQQETTVSEVQMEAFRSAMGFKEELELVKTLSVPVPKYSIVGNSRPFQPLGSRTVQLFAGVEESRTTNNDEDDNDDDDDYAEKLALAGLIVACIGLLLAVVAVIVACTSRRRDPEPAADQQIPVVVKSDNSPFGTQ